MTGVVHLPEGTEMVMPGDNTDMMVEAHPADRHGGGPEIAIVRVAARSARVASRRSSSDLTYVCSGGPGPLRRRGPPRLDHRRVEMPLAHRPQRDGARAHVGGWAPTKPVWVSVGENDSGGALDGHGRPTHGPVPRARPGGVRHRRCPGEPGSRSDALPGLGRRATRRAPRRCPRGSSR